MLINSLILTDTWTFSLLLISITCRSGEWRHWQPWTEGERLGVRWMTPQQRKLSRLGSTATSPGGTWRRPGSRGTSVVGWMEPCSTKSHQGSGEGQLWRCQRFFTFTNSCLVLSTMYFIQGMGNTHGNTNVKYFGEWKFYASLKGIIDIQGRLTEPFTLLVNGIKSYM